MTVDRRTFLKSAAVAGGALGLHGIPAQAAALTGAGRSPATGVPSASRPSAPLRILILGGTGFIGPEQVHYARIRGHTVTLFNRGRTNPWLFPDVEKLQGDRDAAGGLDALRGRTWDVVIDNPTGKPKWIVDAAAVLK